MNPEKVNSNKAIWVFTPSRTDPKDLEYILVQRHKLLEDAVERVRESALTAHKHHLLFVGPRGCGKTHLVTLIVSRLAGNDELAEHLRIAWLNEDETCTTLLELLLKIHAALERRYPDHYTKEMLAPAYDREPSAALAFVSNHLLSSLGNRTLLVAIENLDAIFEELGESGQKEFRSLLQENPKLTIVATAQRLVEDLSDRARPFFGFFQIEYLKPLNVDEATELLRNIAELNDKQDVVEFLSTNRGRSRVRALHHLSGGNHRIYIVLSQFITRDSIDALLAPFMKMVDELTPYYQERIRWLPPLQRKIVETLCACETTVPVKEIARRLFSTPQTISSQLQNLREKGYVESNQRGRESLYEVSEPLMRICVEVKENQSHQPLRLLVDFLRVWYDDQELRQRIKGLEPTSASCVYLQSAILKNCVAGNLRKRILLEELESLVRDWNQKEALQCLDEFIASECVSSETVTLLVCRGLLNLGGGIYSKAVQDFTEAIELPGAPVEQIAKAFVNRGACYGQLGESQRELADYTTAIELHGAPLEQVSKALVNRGFCHCEMGETDRAIADFTTVIDLPNAPLDQVALALIGRGLSFRLLNEHQSAIVDFTALIDIPGVPISQFGRALLNRGLCHGRLGEAQLAITDYTAVINLPEAPVEQVAKALLNRGMCHDRLGNTQGAMSDFTALIDLPNAPVEEVAKALVNRSLRHSKGGNLQSALLDCTTAIELPGAPVRQIGIALVSRGLYHSQLGDVQRAMADYTAVIDLPGAPPEQIAVALINRAIRRKSEETQFAIADYTTVIDLPGAPAEQVAQAFAYRATCYGEAGDIHHAIADCTAAIHLPHAPVEPVAIALTYRGICHVQKGETERAIEDYTMAIELPNAPLELVTQALFCRGVIHFQQARSEKAQSDFEALIRLPNASPVYVADAYFALAELHFSEGKWSPGFHALKKGLERSHNSLARHDGSTADVVGALFSAGLNPEGRQDKVRELLNLYEEYHAPSALGEAVIQHIATMFLKGEPFPSSDNLEGWISAWEHAAEKVEGFRLSVRLLRTAVNFVKAGGKDPGILLDLTAPERAILEQAFGLAEKVSKME